MLWLALFVGSLVVALLLGRVYCGYVCPMHTLMIPVEWISKKLKLQTKKSPKWLLSGKLPWFSLVGSVAIMILGRRILHKSIPILIIWLAVSILITLRFRQAVFHNLVCPFGILQKTVGRFAVFSKKVNKNDCIGCKICEKVCPSDAIAVISENKKAEINTSLCFQCYNCQQVCPKDSIITKKV